MSTVRLGSGIANHTNKYAHDQEQASSEAFEWGKGGHYRSFANPTIFCRK